MKKKIVKLTEQDLEKLVKKIIKEEEMDPNAPEGEEGDGKMSSGVQKRTYPFLVNCLNNLKLKT